MATPWSEDAIAKLIHQAPQARHAAQCAVHSMLQSWRVKETHRRHRPAAAQCQALVVHLVNLVSSAPRLYTVAASAVCRFASQQVAARLGPLGALALHSGCANKYSTCRRTEN